MQKCLSKFLPKTRKTGLDKRVLGLFRQFFCIQEMYLFQQQEAPILIPACDWDFLIYCRVLFVPSHSSRLCCKIPGTNFALHFVIWLYVWKSCVSLSFFWITQCPFFAPTPSLTPIIRSLSGRLRTLRLVWHRQPPLGHWDWFFQPGFGNQRCSPLQSTVESHTRRTR